MHIVMYNVHIFAELTSQSGILRKISEFYEVSFLLSGGNPIFGPNFYGFSVQKMFHFQKIYKSMHY